MAIDSQNNFIVTGITTSSNFPTTSITHQTKPKGSYDIFVTKFSSDGELIWSTLFGSDEFDKAFKVKVDKYDNIWFCGEVWGNDFPIVGKAIQRQYGGGTGDAMFCKLSSEGELLYSTYYGGSAYDVFGDLDIDRDDNIWMIGRTVSSNIVTKNANKSNKTGTYDAIIVKVDNEANLLYSSYFGGSDSEFGEGIICDSEDNIYISGYTYSNDFPCTSDA